MTSELLREAAALMRKNVEGVGHVTRVNDGQAWWTADILMAAGFVAFREDAEHIASWHPAVASAVADSIDSALTWFDPEDCTEAERGMHDALLAVARAYLGQRA